MHINLRSARNREDYVKNFAAFPKDETLDLSNNKLNNTTVSHLVGGLNALTAPITHLNLSANELYNCTGDQLIEIMKAVPVTVTHLDLSENELYSLQIHQLIRVLQAIPESITHLNLSGNVFSLMLAADLASVLKALPHHIKHLDFSNNRFEARTGAELVEILRALPDNIISLDLSKNNLCELSINEIQSLKGTLHNVKSIYLSRSEINKMNTEKRKLLTDVFPNAVGIAIRDSRGHQQYTRDSFLRIEKPSKNLFFSDNDLPDEPFSPKARMN